MKLKQEDESRKFFCNFDEYSTINENICGGFDYNVTFVQIV